MEGIAGDLGTMPIPDLLLYLSNKSLTGTLVCERGNVKKSVSLKNGEVINAASNDPREYLGQFLINFGHINEDQLTKAFQTQAETKVFLGRILVMIGLVNEETLKQVLAIKIRETTLGLCRWKDGTFKFARGVLPPDQESVEVSVPLADIHREAEFRDTAWDAMMQVFPSARAPLKLNEAKVPDGVAPGSLDGLLFDLLREGYGIEEISLRLHATDFHLYQRLYALYRQGVVSVEAADPSEEVAIDAVEEVVGEELPVPELLAHVKEFLAAKQFVDAELLAARAVEMKSTPESYALLREAEAGLLEVLKRDLLTNPLVPRLVDPNLKLRDLNLTPQEKYLLSRVDGTRDLRAIIRVSPVRELDALKFFRKALEDKLIAVL